MKKYRFLFTGGGTGGHVYPNVAIYEALKEKYPDAEFLYVGTRKGSEAAIIPALSQPMEFVHVPARGLPQRLRSLRTLLALAAIFLGAVKSFIILLRFKPDVIIGSGGYAAAPVLLAAALLKKSAFIHEQNAVPGRLNLFVARFATRIGVAFPSTASFFPAAKVFHAGYPLRRAIRTAAADENRQGREKLGIPPNSRVLFIFSGSLGARTVNRAVTEAMPRLLSIPNLFVVMSTGKAYSSAYKAYDDTVGRLEHQGLPPQIDGRLLVREYFDQIAEVYDVSDLVVSRSGAGTIQELTAKGLPAILVPKIDLPGDHQVLNAREMEKAGGARVLYEEVGGTRRPVEIVLAADALVAAVGELIADPGQLASMRGNLLAMERPDSTARILEALDGILHGKGAAREGEVRAFYLQAVDEEKNLELPFPSTTVGNTFLSDVELARHAPPVRFTVQLLPGGEFPAMARVQKGRVLLNGREINDWVVLRQDDRLEVGGQRLHLQELPGKDRSAERRRQPLRPVQARLAAGGPPGRFRARRRRRRPVRRRPGRRRLFRRPGRRRLPAPPGRVQRHEPRLHADLRPPVPALAAAQGLGSGLGAERGHGADLAVHRRDGHAAGVGDHRPRLPGVRPGRNVDDGRQHAAHAAAGGHAGHAGGADDRLPARLRPPPRRRGVGIPVRRRGHRRHLPFLSWQRPLCPGLEHPPRIAAADPFPPCPSWLSPWPGRGWNSPSARRSAPLGR